MLVCQCCNLKITEEEGMFTCVNCNNVCCFNNCFILYRELHLSDEMTYKIKFLCIKCYNILT